MIRAVFYLFGCVLIWPVFTCKEKIVNVAIIIGLGLSLYFASLEEISKWIKIILLNAGFLSRSVPKWIGVYSLLLLLWALIFLRIICIKILTKIAKGLRILSWNSCSRHTLFYKFGVFGSDKARFYSLIALFIFQFLLKLEQLLHRNISIKVNDFFVKLLQFSLFCCLFLLSSSSFFLNDYFCTLRGI